MCGTADRAAPGAKQTILNLESTAAQQCVERRVLNAVFDLVGADDGDASLEGVLLPDFGLCARSYFSVRIA